MPFCAAICNYCNFNRGLHDDGLRQRYVDALVTDIRRSAEPAVAADTIFFGGGTPSLLDPAEVDRLITACRESFDLAADSEITLEANPESATAATLDGYRAAGVNRLSFGVQSFRDEDCAATIPARRARAARGRSNSCGSSNSVSAPNARTTGGALSASCSWSRASWPRPSVASERASEEASEGTPKEALPRAPREIAAAGSESAQRRDNPADVARRQATEQERLAGRMERLEQSVRQLAGAGGGAAAGERQALAEAAATIERERLSARMREAARAAREQAGAGDAGPGRRQSGRRRIRPRGSAVNDCAARTGRAHRNPASARQGRRPERRAAAAGGEQGRRRGCRGSHRAPARISSPVASGRPAARATNRSVSATTSRA